MDKLENLQRIVSAAANEQASQVHSLIVAAGQQGQDHVIFRTPCLHPLVVHTLTARGYVVTELPPTGFMPGVKTFRIGL